MYCALLMVVLLTCAAAGDEDGNDEEKPPAKKPKKPYMPKEGTLTEAYLIILLQACSVNAVTFHFEML